MCSRFYHPETLWHNSKHNKNARAFWDWEIRGADGVVYPCLIIFCAVTKKRKRTGKKKKKHIEWMRTPVLLCKECRGYIINPTSVRKPVPFVVCMHRDYDEKRTRGGFRYCVPLSRNHDKLLSRAIVYSELHHPPENSRRGSRARTCNVSYNSGILWKRFFFYLIKQKIIIIIHIRNNRNIKIMCISIKHIQCSWNCGVFKAHFSFKSQLHFL